MHHGLSSVKSYVALSTMSIITANQGYNFFLNILILNQIFVGKNNYYFQQHSALSVKTNDNTVIFRMTKHSTITDKTHC